MLAIFWMTKTLYVMVANEQDSRFFNSESSCIQTVFKSKKVIDHKLLEDVHEESLQNPRQNSRFLCNRRDEPLKASGRPVVFYTTSSGR
jgi:hypothetical protein